MITPETPDRLYSTRMRTALVLTGSGTAGAYHAGVLRALHEAGIKIDLVAGRGIGAAAAVFAAIDGGARLWEPEGVWKGGGRGFYRWRLPLRLAGWAVAAGVCVLAIPFALLAAAVLVGIAGLLLTLIGLDGAGAAVTGAYGRWIATLFSPSFLPTVIPRLALLAILAAVIALVVGAIVAAYRPHARRRARSGLAGRAIGGPLTSTPFVERCAAELWSLIRGAAPLAAPARPELGRRYLELLTENLGQPGFREIVVTAHDLDVKRDLVFALLGAKHRARFFTRPAPSDGGVRQIEAFDLTGAARDHVFDALSGALALPMACEPHLISFAPEGPWRGETHRLCDRPAALARLLEETAAAGAEQIIIVTAAPPPGRPHEMSGSRADVRGRAGEQLASAEAAAVRDAVELFAGRFAGLFVIRPVHNPLAPLDFGGVYDERSDRTHTLAELVDRGYEDAYRQFIEPVVGASGEKIATVQQ